MRNVCFTSFEKDPPVKTDEMSYLVYGKEICPETGKEHWQGYAEFKAQHTINSVKSLLGSNKIHVETRKGTGVEAATYCKKDGKFTEFGCLKSQGKRNDLTEVAEVVAGGAKLSDVAATFPEQFIKYHKGLKAFKDIVDKKRTCKEQREVEVIVLTGPTGCGKTRYAYDNYDDIYSLNTSGAKLWFDGYEGEKCLLIDEFCSSVKMTELLRLLDRYPYQCEVKGGHVYAQWTTVIITSNIPFTSWYPGALKEHKLALERRITQKLNFYEKKDSPLTPRPPERCPQTSYSEVGGNTIPQLPSNDENERA